MKIRQEKILFPAQSTFKAIKYSAPFFDMSFHFHAEFELVYITRGSGTRYIGDRVQRFRAGDMVFMGPGLAHIWITPGKNRQPKGTLKVEAIVLQFPPTLFDSLLKTPEFALIDKLFKAARAGLKITGETRIKVLAHLNELLESRGPHKFAVLLDLLDVLAHSSSLQRLSTARLAAADETQDSRINRIQNFVLSYFGENISSRDAALLANLEHSSFCRFFKEKTGKTFTEYLNSTRIDRACQLLLTQRISVTQAAFECGFGNMAHFYRQFRRHLGMTPKEFLRA